MIAVSKNSKFLYEKKSLNAFKLLVRLCRLSTKQ